MEVNTSIKVCYYNRRNDHVRRDSFDNISFCQRYGPIVGAYELNLRVYDFPATTGLK